MINENILSGKKNIHFIGIGGSGMFPLAQILQHEGYNISGSDINESATLKIERNLGMKIFVGHSPENLEGVDLVVYTAAIMNDNLELLAAKESGITTLERAELLGIVSRMKKDCIGVCGTHGKTTTTSMITQILMGAGKDPSAIIGGKLPSIGGNARVGKSEIMVIEACEYVNTFHNIYPKMAIILNIDEDHMEFFGTLDNVIKSYRRFAENTSDTIVVNGDDVNSMKSIEGLSKKIVTFGISDTNDYYIRNMSFEDRENNSFDLMYKKEKLCTVVINVPGKHNMLDALAACVGCLEIGCTVDEVVENIKAFTGAGRRFELVGKYNGADLVDDYAHHPAEIEVTLNTARQLGYRRIWAIFQPFTFSRTSILLDEFARVLKTADRVILTPIMGAREINTYGIDSKDLGDKIPGSIILNTFEEIAQYIKSNAGENDIFITLGCGDVYKVFEIFKKIV